MRCSLLCGLIGACSVLMFSNEAVVADYATTVLADNPVGYYRLGESMGPTADDIGSADLDGAYSGGVTYGVSGALYGSSNTAVTLNGSDGIATIPNDASHQFAPLGAFTLEAWVNTNTGGGTFLPFVSNWTGSGGYFMALYSPSGASGPFQLLGQISGTGGTAYKHTNTTTNLADGEWHHVVLTHADGTATAAGLSLYVDGTLQTTLISDTIGDPITSIANGVPLYIGTRDDAIFYQGSVDEVAIYGTAFTGSQVLAHYNAAVPEPGSIVVLSIGLFGSFALSRRLRRRR